MNVKKAQGTVKYQGREIPYYGTVNDMSEERWNALCEQQAVKLYRQETGKEPESGEAALQFLNEWMAAQEAKKHHSADAQPNDIPIRRATGINYAS